MNEHYYKVRFQTDPDGLSGGNPERLWAKRVSTDDLCFELHNSPFYAKGVSFLDVVEASEKPGYPEEFDYARTVRPSGHSTYRVLVEKDMEATGFTKFWDRLEQLGCTYEYSDEGTGRLYAVDVPPGTDIFRVYQILQEGEDGGVWLFDEGHCGHSKLYF